MPQYAEVIDAPLQMRCCDAPSPEMVLTDLIFSAAEEKKCAERDAYEGPGARFGNG